MSEEKKPTWTENHIAYIKGMTKSSEQQQLLVILHEMASRTPQDEKKYLAIERAEKAAERAAKARRDATNYINSEAKAKAAADKKVRDHHLIQIGALFEILDIDKRPAGELLGLLMAGASAANADPTKWAAWKQRGDALLMQRKQAQEAARASAKGN